MLMVPFGKIVVTGSAPVAFFLSRGLCESYESIQNSGDFR